VIKASKSAPPDSLPVYRLLTGPDDAAFCHRVSEALAMGYRLYGSPAATFNGQNVIVAQAIVWPVAGEPVAAGASPTSRKRRSRPPRGRRTR
jgi:hypothetical protein